MKTFQMVLLALVLSFGIAGTGNATLTVLGTDSLGNQLIYDSGLNITWYDYTNPPGGYSYNNWQDQVNWANNLAVTFQGRTITGWSLPTVGPVNGSFYQESMSDNGSKDFGYNISAPGSAYPGSTASQIAYLYYYELGNLGFYDVNGNVNSNSGLIHTGPFQHFYWNTYWLNTADPNNPSYAYCFDTGGGAQGACLNTYYWYGIAVIPGEVGASVPIPAAVWLLGSGLIGLIGVRRKFKK